MPLPKELEQRVREEFDKLLLKLLGVSGFSSYIGSAHKKTIEDHIVSTLSQALDDKVREFKDLIEAKKGDIDLSSEQVEVLDFLLECALLNQ